MTGRMRIERLAGRCLQQAVRALSGWLAFSLALSLTPCCELIAGIFPIRSAQAAEHTHTHVDGSAPGHAPAGQPDPCPSWLDTTSPALPAGFVSAVGPEPEAAVYAPAVARHLVQTRHAPQRRIARAPPAHSIPLYLRFSRLLA